MVVKYTLYILISSILCSVTALVTINIYAGFYIDILSALILLINLVVYYILIIKKHYNKKLHNILKQSALYILGCSFSCVIVLLTVFLYWSYVFKDF